MIFDGAMQLAGTVLLVAGLIGKQVLVADVPGIVAVMPITTPHGGAWLAMLARF